MRKNKNPHFFKKICENHLTFRNAMYYNKNVIQYITFKNKIRRLNVYVEAKYKYKT